MKHHIVDCPSAKSGVFDMGFISKSKTEYPTMELAQKALKDVKLTSDDRKRIHKCFHNDKNKACEIIN